MTQEPERPNFFILLGLDPDGSWDRAAFERSLTEHRSTWTRQRNGISTNQETKLARWCLSNFKDIERVMRDPAQRSQEQAAARQRQADDQHRQLDDFVEKLDLMLAKGFLFDVELITLEADMVGIAGADTALRKGLTGVQVRSFERAQSDRERLDLTSELIIKENLATLAEASLYSALAIVDGGITEASPRDRLLAAADSLYRKTQNTADKTKPKVRAMQRLAGQARQIFADDDLTRRYNYSMLVAPLEELAARYRKDLETVGRVDASQSERFLRTAAEKRIDPDVARDFLVRYFRERHWEVDLPSAATERTLRRLVSCPRCATLNEPEVPFCQDCGRAMHEACPGCGLEVPAGARVCPACSFPTGERDWAEYLVEEAESSLGREDLAGATENVLRAERAWPAGADSTNDLAVRIRSARQSVTRLEAARGLEAKHIAELMQDDRYRAALLRLRGLNLALPSFAGLTAECERKVTEAHDLCRDAERPGTSADRKAELFLDALRICKDYEPASQGLESIPPEPPHNLRVTADESRMMVRLTWEQESSLGCTWIVVRAQGAEAPVTPADLPGQRVSRGISSPAWTDPDPMTGVPVRYAVFTQRGAVTSMLAAIAPDAVFFTKAAELRITTADRTIRLTWTLPPNALNAELQRAEIGSLAAPVYLPAERGQNYLVDRNVENGVRYRYTIRARFADPTTGRQGDVRYSEPEVAEVTPSAPPSPPPAPRAQGGPPPPGMPFYVHEVQLRWSPPNRGVIMILRADSHVTLRAGDDLTEGQFTRKGIVLNGSAQCSDTLFGTERFLQYFPALAVDGHYYVGHPRRYLVGSEVNELSAEYASNSVRLRWTWPELGDEALVAWDENAEIPDPLIGPMQARVARNTSETTGRFDIPVDPNAKLFILVAVVARDRGLEFVSSGASITAQRPSTALHYEIRSVRGAGGRKGELVLRPERPAWLPGLELHGRTDNHPASRSDPLLLTLRPGQSDRERVERFPLGSASPQSCRLFVAKDSDDYGVRVIHPD